MQVPISIPNPFGTFPSKIDIGTSKVSSKHFVAMVMGVVRWYHSITCKISGYVFHK